MAGSSKPILRFVRFLGGILTVTAILIVVLVFWTRPTVVELRLEVDRIAFTVLPSGLSPEKLRDPSTPSLLSSVSLLTPELEVEAMEVRDFDQAEASLDGRSTVLRAGSGGLVVIRAIDSEVPFQPSLTAHKPVMLSIETSGRARTGGEKVTLEIEPAVSEDRRSGSGAVWNSELSTGAELILEPREVEASGPSPARLDRASYTLPETAPAVFFRGGARRSRLSVSLQPRPAATTLLRIIDPKTGKATEQRLEIGLPEVPALVWGDRIVSLRPEPVDDQPRDLLEPGLQVRALHFVRQEKLEAKSTVLGGQIRFPAGERPDLDIAPGSFLLIESEEPLSLRSLGVTGDRLILTLWGEPVRVALGPTPELRREILPSLFEWMYTHQLRALVYSTLAWIVGTALTGAQMFGLFHGGDD